MQIQTLTAHFPEKHKLWSKNCTEFSVTFCSCLELKTRVCQAIRCLDVNLLIIIGYEQYINQKQRNYSPHPTSVSVISVCSSLSLTHRSIMSSSLDDLLPWSEKIQTTTRNRSPKSMSDQVCFKPRSFQAAFLQSGTGYEAFTAEKHLYEKKDCEPKSITTSAHSLFQLSNRFMIHKHSHSFMFHSRQYTYHFVPLSVYTLFLDYQFLCGTPG